MNEDELAALIYGLTGDVDASVVLEELRLLERWQRLHPEGDMAMVDGLLGGAAKAKAAKVFSEWGKGQLRSGKGKGGKPGPKVTSRKQAVAIALSEGREAGKDKS
jgi:hypothetical protein